MSVFGRRKKGTAVDQDDSQDPSPQEQVEVEQAESVPAPPPRPQGPWDDADAPDDEVNRIDLGGLLVPVPSDTEVRVEVSPEGAVIAATLVQGESAMQVNAFAAPRSAGIWSQIRDEIGTTLRESGGQAQDAEGPHGTELHAFVPTEVPGQGLALTPARFIGVDGPRWFLRALLTGPAATDRAVAAQLEAALRDIVVLRGTDPMAVRDPLPLRLPTQVTTPEPTPASPEQPSLELPERGPEITELR